MANAPSIPPFEKIQIDARHENFRRFSWWAVAKFPFWAALFVWFGLTQPPLWRQLLVVAMLATGFLITLWDFVRSRQGEAARVPTSPMPRWVMFIGVFYLMLVLATGGLESPFLYVFPLLSFYTSSFAPRKLARILLVGVQIPSVLLLAAISVFELIPDLIPPLFGGGDNAGHPQVLLWSTAVMVAMISYSAHWLAMFLRNSHAQVLHRAAAERDRALEMHVEQGQALTRLSGEIAHELKNPLASVKGLAALMALDLEGEAAEQMTVLRREVDRMQTVLEEFLNFSRPLVPLTQEPLDLATLAREVTELHQGMAVQRGVAINVRSAGSIRSTCDDRKVRQILINLLQNALEVSDRGSEVTIEASLIEPDQAALRVLDRGSGLSRELEGRFFEPGVTNKPNGSGLGLTVARALARQHGGTLTLSDRDGGGCVAELRIPREPPDEEVETS